MTHPFHPWFGEEFDLAFIRHAWGEERVYLTDASGELCSLPIGFTDVMPPDPFVVVAAGRCPFRLGDLVALAELAERLRPNGVSGALRPSRQADYAVHQLLSLGRLSPTEP